VDVTVKVNIWSWPALTGALGGLAVNQELPDVTFAVICMPTQVPAIPIVKLCEGGFCPTSVLKVRLVGLGFSKVHTSGWITISLFFALITNSFRPWRAKPSFDTSSGIVLRLTRF